jgi:hypothetical protein
MKMHLGLRTHNCEYILITDDMYFYWTYCKTEIYFDKLSNGSSRSKNIEEWIKNCPANNIRYLGYFDTDECSSINVYKENYPEFFI